MLYENTGIKNFLDLKKVLPESYTPLSCVIVSIARSNLGQSCNFVAK
jgi:hypothetical protein